MSTLLGGYAEIETDADKIYLYDAIPSSMVSFVTKQKGHLIIDGDKYEYYFYNDIDHELYGHTKKLIKKSKNKYIEEVDEITIEGDHDTPMELGDIDSGEIKLGINKQLSIENEKLHIKLYIPANITYNNVNYLPHDQPIGSGSFGVVFKYLSNDRKGFALKAIKVGGDDFEHDRKIIEFLRKQPDRSVCSDYYIKSFEVGDYIIMPLVEGDIGKLKDKLTDHNQYIYILL